jgi:pimeloyl-ACP methyl ester carboxylesterase
MIIRWLAALALTLACVSCRSSPSRSSGITTETFMIPALDAGIELHVRNKRTTGAERFDAERIVLFVHGATFPSETGFDIDLPGGSWMEFAARRGFDAYCVDVRGYGRSTRPAAMAQPPEANPPFADTREAVRDIAAAVDFIRQRRGVATMNLVGW